VLPDQPGRRIFVDYDVADWITVEADEGDSDPSILQVLAATINIDKDANVNLELSVGSRFDARSVALKRLLDKMGAQNVSGSTSAVPISPSAVIAAARFSDLNDVNTTGAGVGDTIVWDGTHWVDAPPAGDPAVTDLTDVDLTGLVHGDMLTWDSINSLWVPTVPSEGGGGGSTGLSFPCQRVWSADGYNGLFEAIRSAAGAQMLAPWGLMSPDTTVATDTPGCPPGAVPGSVYRITTSQSADHTSKFKSFRAVDRSIAYDGAIATGGESHTPNTANSWWKMDFGVGYFCTPTRFGIYGRSSGDQHPRNFKIQGSNDNTNWTDLHTVTSAGPTNGTWWSNAITGAGAYRYIRLYMTGLNSSSANYLVLGDVEIWGTLTAPISSGSWDFRNLSALPAAWNRRGISSETFNANGLSASFVAGEGYWMYIAPGATETTLTMKVYSQSSTNKMFGPMFHDGTSGVQATWYSGAPTGLLAAGVNGSWQYNSSFTPQSNTVVLPQWFKIRKPTSGTTYYVSRSADGVTYGAEITFTGPASPGIISFGTIYSDLSAVVEQVTLTST
jgi:hypothetical protein